MMVEPKPTLEGIGKITDHVFLGNRHLGLGDRQGSRKANPIYFQGPRTEGRAHQPVKVIVGDDLLIDGRFSFHRLIQQSLLFVKKSTTFFLL